ncbi:glutaredoxin [Bacteriovoracaceae bacterium]|nr:glutaredoxin [Bacteriovoracaceae bacterium]
MMNKLELFITQTCPFCLRVLDVVAQEYPQNTIAIVDLNEEPEKAKLHYQTTGRYTVPCLYIDGNPLFESMDIIGYLIKNKNNILNQD